MNIKLAGKVNILIIVGFPGLHAGSQGFFKTQVGRPAILEQGTTSSLKRPRRSQWDRYSSLFVPDE